MNNFRTIDGSANHPDNLGQTGASLRRLLDPAYENDGVNDDLPRGIIEGEPDNPFIGASSLPNPREISNTVSAQTESVNNYLNASDWIWQWGQFLDHDLDLNEGGEEPFFIPIDPDDPLAPRIEEASIVSIPTSDGDEEQLLVIESDEELTLPLFNDTPEETISLEELMSSDEFVVTDEFIEDLEEDFDVDLIAGDSPTTEPAAGDSQTTEEDIPFITFTRIPDADESEPSRQYINEITSFIDGSQVYGSEEERAEFLRANDGTGKLKSQIVNGEELLPLEADSEFFAAGDTRVNEQNGLTSAHTLFLREHNRIAEEIGNRIEQGDASILNLLEDSGLETGDFIYESARKVVGAELQFITYNEYLPLLLGDSALGGYSGYNTSVNPTISVEFANVSFRLGHSQLSNEIQRVDSNGNSNSIALQDAFFDPQKIKDNGVDSLLAGLPTQIAQEVDNLLVDGVRNFLFGAETGGFDLAAVNIQRGRDVGLPSYNDARRGFGLAPATSFLTTDSEQGITSNAEIAERFAAIYESVEDVDFWIGGISEDSVNGGLVGELFSVVLTEQFTNLRDGDRFFYLNDSDDLAVLAPDLENTTLSNIIQRNTSEDIVIQENAFLVPGLAVETLDSEENAENIDFTVSLSDVSGATVTVDYETVDAVGTAGEDYVANSGTLTFNPGEQTKTVSVSLLNDAVLQDNKTFFLRLSNPSNDRITQGLAVSQPTIEREILGTPSDDVLNGSFFRDSIEGDAGNDVISGGLGNDVIEGDDGNDLLNGEFNSSGRFNLNNARNLSSFLTDTDEENTVEEELTVEEIEQLDPENVTLLFGTDNVEEIDFQADGTLDLDRNQLDTDGSVSVEDNLPSDSNQLNIEGFLSSNDTQLGGNGNDTLNGGFGSDTQLGGDGNDTLNGDFNFNRRFNAAGFSNFFDGNDVQIGGDGNDKLIGGGGNDKLNGTGDRFGVGEIDELTGGSGGDIFVLGERETVFYSRQSTSDYALITDFVPGQDTIELSGEITDYVLAPTSGNLPQGTGLYLDLDSSGEFTSGTDELIAISTQTFSSLDNGFSFV